MLPTCMAIFQGELSATSDYASSSSNHDTQFIVVRAVNLNYPKFYSDVGVRKSGTFVMKLNQSSYSEEVFRKFCAISGRD